MYDTCMYIYVSTYVYIYIIYIYICMYIYIYIHIYNIGTAPPLEPVVRKQHKKLQALLVHTARYIAEFDKPPRLLSFTVLSTSLPSPFSISLSPPSPPPFSFSLCLCLLLFSPPCSLAVTPLSLTVPWLLCAWGLRGKGHVRQQQREREEASTCAREREGDWAGGASPALLLAQLLESEKQSEIEQ